MSAEEPPGEARPWSAATRALLGLLALAVLLGIASAEDVASSQARGQLGLDVPEPGSFPRLPSQGKAPSMHAPASPSSLLALALLLATGGACLALTLRGRGKRHGGGDLSAEAPGNPRAHIPRTPYTR